MEKKPKEKKPRATNSWVSFVKEYALKKGITYSCALSDPRAKDEYKQGKIPMKEQPMMVEMPKKKNDQKQNLNITEIYKIIDDYIKKYNSISPNELSKRKRVADEIKEKVEEYEKKTNSILKRRGYNSITDTFPADYIWFDKQSYDKKVDKLKKKL